MPEKRGSRVEKRKVPHLWWLSGVVFFALALLGAKFTLNLGYLLMSHDHDKDHWLFPVEVWADNAKTEFSGKTEAPAQVASSEKNRRLLMMGDDSGNVAKMVTHLEQREAELNRKEEELRRKEEYLGQMQKETEAKLKQLIAVQEEIQAYREEKESAESSKLKALVKIYESMKPKGAAKLLESLDDDLVVKIISNMNTGLAASILANMSPDKAVKISEALTTP